MINVYHPIMQMKYKGKKSENIIHRKKLYGELFRIKMKDEKYF